MSNELNDEAVAGAAAGEPRSADEIRQEIEQTREQLGETVEALAEKTDVKAQARDRIGGVKETVAGNVDSTRETVSAKAGSARETVSAKAGDVIAKARASTPESATAGAAELGSTVQERPLPFAAAGAFAAGLLLGCLLRRG